MIKKVMLKLWKCLNQLFRAVSHICYFNFSKVSVVAAERPPPVRVIEVIIFIIRKLKPKCTEGRFTMGYQSLA